MNENQTELKQMRVFINPEFGEIRTIDINGEPWFVGTDVAEILGYDNTIDALAVHVDSEDKRIIQRSENTIFEIPNKMIIVINVSGLHSLIYYCNLPIAKTFKRWVTSEVIPSIRKTSQCISEEQFYEFINNSDLPLFSHLKTLNTKIERLQELIHELLEQNKSHNTTI